MAALHQGLRCAQKAAAIHSIQEHPIIVITGGCFRAIFASVAGSDILRHCSQVEVEWKKRCWAVRREMFFRPNGLLVQVFTLDEIRQLGGNVKI